MDSKKGERWASRERGLVRLSEGLVRLVKIPLTRKSSRRITSTNSSIPLKKRK